MLNVRHVLPEISCIDASQYVRHGCAQFNKLIMIDRTFYGSETPNPTGIKASEYDVVTGANRDLTSGIQTNSWCSAVRTNQHRGDAGVLQTHSLHMPSTVPAAICTNIICSHGSVDATSREHGETLGGQQC